MNSRIEGRSFAMIFNEHLNIFDMKKRLLILGTVVLISSSSIAQTTLFSENFATAQSQQAGWTIVDGDLDGNNWGFYDFGVNPSATLNTTLNTALNAQGRLAISSSYAVSALTPNNYFISPSISLANIQPLTGNITLSFKVGSTQSSTLFTSEKVSVYVVSDISSVSAINSATPVHSAVLAGVGINSFTYDISSYGGQSVYLVFRHHDCTDEGDLLLDDISVVKTLAAGIGENEIVSSVYPNPANDVLNIELQETIATVSILSIDGKLISTQTVNELSTAVDVQSLPAGLYTYKVATVKGNFLVNNFIKN